MDKLLLAEPVLSTIYGQVTDYLQNLSAEVPSPRLDILMIGDNAASEVYVAKKIQACQKYGVQTKLHKFEDLSHENTIQLIQELNADPFVSGILVQLPLPSQINLAQIIKTISPRKDVDGFHAYNLGKLMSAQEFEYLSPCTPKAVLSLLDHYQIPILGQDICIVGCSNIVGKPLANMLINRMGTVTVCHKDTRDLQQHTRQADLLISATGVPNLITKDMIKPGAVLIDVGFSKRDNKIYGDIDPNCLELAARLAPVPGGVGPLTVAHVVLNTILAHKWHIENS